MVSKPRNSVPTAGRRLRMRRSSNSKNKKPLSKPRSSAAHIGGGGASVSDRLEALRNLIPSKSEEIVKPDQLFRDTADYIVLLETQVLVLQKLVDFYGSQQPQENRDVV